MAVSLLLERIQGTRMGPPERFEPPFQLVVRESTIGSMTRRTAPQQSLSPAAAIGAS
jgi:hypothetical protein